MSTPAAFGDAESKPRGHDRTMCSSGYRNNAAQLSRARAIASHALVGGVPSHDLHIVVGGGAIQLGVLADRHHLQVDPEHLRCSCISERVPQREPHACPQGSHFFYLNWWEVL